MTERLSLARVPILVLGSHRSGTSLVTGVLATAGMAVGDVLEPGPDNPRGYFEAAAVLAVHEAMLADLGRDWTCPPAWLTPEILDLDGLREAVESVSASATGRWGVKDPRTMYLLAAWMQVTPLIQPIGVVRDPAAVAASLAKRNGLEDRHAYDIAVAYTERLAELHRQLGFPIVNFSTDRVALLGRMKTLAPLLDLSWDGAAAEDLFAKELVHHVGGEPSDDPSYRYLLERAHDPVTSAPVLDAEAVYRALEHTPSAATKALSTNLWSVFKGRVERLWNAATERHDSPGNVAMLLPEDANLDWHPAEVAPDHVERWTALPNEGHDVTHIVAPGLLDETSSMDVAPLLERLASVTADDAVVSTEVLLAGIYDRPEIASWPHLSTTSFRNRMPYHHHRVDLEAAIVGSGWRVGRLEVVVGKRSVMVLVKHRHRVESDYLPAPEALAQLPELLAASRVAIDEAQTLKVDLAGYESHVANYERRVGELDARIVALTGDLEHRENLIAGLQEELEKAASRLSEESAATAQSRARLEWERDRHRAAVEQLLQDNAGLRHWLTETRNDLALRTAELAAEQRKVAFAAKFVPKPLARRLWRRFGAS